jgi:hypothetical protein
VFPLLGEEKGLPENARSYRNRKVIASESFTLVEAGIEVGLTPDALVEGREVGPASRPLEVLPFLPKAMKTHKCNELSLEVNRYKTEIKAIYSGL